MNNSNNFKIGLLSLAILLFAGFTASEVFSKSSGWGNCERGKGKGYHHGSYHGFHHLDAMKSELKLTDTQVKKIFDIGTEYRKKYFDSRSDNEKLEKLRIEHKKDIENVLTAEQKKIFNSNKNTHSKYGWYGGCPYR